MPTNDLRDWLLWPNNGSNCTGIEEECFNNANKSYYGSLGIICLLAIGGYLLYKYIGKYGRPCCPTKDEPLPQCLKPTTQGPDPSSDKSDLELRSTAVLTELNTRSNTGLNKNSDKPTPTVITEPASFSSNPLLTPLLSAQMVPMTQISEKASSTPSSNAQSNLNRAVSFNL